MSSPEVRVKRDHDAHVRRRLRLRDLQRRLRLVESIDAFVETPAWTGVLKPTLLATTTEFEKRRAYDAPLIPTGDDTTFLEHRGMALYAKRLLQMVEGQSGTRDTILSEIAKVKDRIAKAKQDGRVKPEWDLEELPT